MSEEKEKKGKLTAFWERLKGRKEEAAPTEEMAHMYRLLDSVTAMRTEVSLQKELSLMEKVDFNRQYGISAEDFDYLKKYGSYRKFMAQDIIRKITYCYGPPGKDFVKWKKYPEVMFLLERAEVPGFINIANTDRKEYVVPLIPYIEKIKQERRGSKEHPFGGESE